MTREEAIKTLKEHKIMFQHDFGWDISTIKALDMAISALSENKGDFISRQAAIDAFERFIHELGIKDEPYNYGEMALSVKNVPSVENKGEWIPVTERLPEDGVEVLCTVREMCDFPDDNEYDVPLTFIAQGHYINHEQKIFRCWYIKVRPDCSMGTDKVIAWMPLPEPYQKGGE